jgi:energy-coupling factor transporter ATP-binding protein EcfA2
MRVGVIVSESSEDSTNAGDTGRHGRSGLRLAGIFAAVAGPPVGVIAAVGIEQVQQNLLTTILLTLLYEAAVTSLTIVGGIVSSLRDRWTQRAIESIDSHLLRLTSRYTNTYLRYIRASTSFVDLQGLTTRGEYTLSLTEIFVDLAVDPNSTSSLESGLVRQRTASETITAQPRPPATIWHWIRQSLRSHEPLVIVGPPGSGKTTLLKHIANILASGTRTSVKHDAPQKIPALVTFRALRSRLEDESLTLADAIRSQCIEVSAKEPIEWFEYQLRKGRLIVMLDGLDELATPSLRERAASWTDRQRRAYPETLFVITSRPFGYRENPLEVATVLQVAAFTDHQIEEFVRRWYEVTEARSFGGHSDASELAASRGSAELLHRLLGSSALRALATNPLLLTMMANVHKYRGALPGTRAELYKEVCAVFLGKRHQARGVELDLLAGQKQAILQQLAFEMMVRSTRDVTANAAAPLIGDVVSRVIPDGSDLSISGLLKRIEETSGLLIERENEVFSFAHLTFQEYLASCHIREKSLELEILARVEDSWWHETIRLFAADADATNIVEECLKHASDLAVLRLAVECMQQAREVSPHVRRKVRELMTPTGTTTDVAALTLAARLSLLRPSRFQPINSSTEISLTPITRLEYQLVLNEERELAGPASWQGRAIPVGNVHEPVLGVPLHSAQAILSWLPSEIEGSWFYRFPNREELSLFWSSQTEAEATAGIARVWTKGRNRWAEPEPAPYSPEDNSSAVLRSDAILAKAADDCVRFSAEADDLFGAASWLTGATDMADDLAAAFSALQHSTEHGYDHSADVLSRNSLVVLQCTE